MGNCPEGMQHIKKHLLNKIYQAPLRTVKVSGIWAILCFLLHLPLPPVLIYPIHVVNLY